MLHVIRPGGIPIALAAITASLVLACGRPGDPQPDPASQPESQSDATLCRTEVTPIFTIQGDAYRSPLAGREVTVRGVVTHRQHGQGFFLEEANARPNPMASRALFVEAPRAELPASGQVLALRGRVAETGDSRDTLTTLVDAGRSAACGEVTELPLTRAALPLDSRQREALEGMRVAFAGEAVVTDVYNAYRGEWTLSAGRPLRIPTEDVPPGDAAAEIANSNRTHALAVSLPGDGFAAVPVGTPVGIRGIMGHDGREQRLLGDEATVPDSLDWPGSPPPAGDALRVVSMNLLNYFNGDGRGGGFPTERGAETAREFAQQQARTRAALTELRPDLLAVQELENDGFGADSAARSLIKLLNESGNGEWTVLNPGVGPIGGDVITVGLFYRPDRLEPVGSPEILRATPFQGLSRQPLAQRFRDRTSKAEFWAAVNHLKSKGSCPETGPNRDQGDGQGCWSPARVAAVNALLPWLQRLAHASATHRVLILGDMNAWRQEDPIRAFRQAGYLELVEERSGLPQYSYLYFGQRGTLDYAFATPALARSARQAFIWHVNADMPRDMPLPLPWLRMSDHDPVIVDFDFSQASTSD